MNDPLNPRLFIGLRVPAAELPQVVQAQKMLKKNADKKQIEVRWSPVSNYHVTIKFLGETPAEKIPQISEVLAELVKSHSCFSLKISNVGAFPDEHHARVLWLGVQSSRKLRALQSEVERSLEALGWPSESREYIPHLTLGRIRKTRSVADMISPLVRKKMGAVVADRLILFESRQHGSFPEYIPLQEYLLQEESSTEEDFND